MKRVVLTLLFISGCSSNDKGQVTPLDIVSEIAIDTMRDETNHEYVTEVQSDGFVQEAVSDTVLEETLDTATPDPQSQEAQEDTPNDTSCEPPSFSDDCSLVTEFQCGFQASCNSGKIYVNWHHHWFCNGVEEITEFACAYTCPHGCEEGEIMDWPKDGKSLVETNCFECSDPSDCVGLEHPMCLGYWECLNGKCSWKCDSECIGEGGSVPVAPGAKDCCPGLVKVPCDKPGPDGECQPCLGASICTYCGDGICGIGENSCNCSDDCGTCLGAGEKFFDFDTKGKCCEGLVPVSDCIPSGAGCACPDCPCYICLPCGDGICEEFENECNCPQDCKGECLGLGGTFIDSITEGKCCEGLTPVPDCDIEDSGCLCKKCPCYICTHCGDGECGPFEHICNCPKDCPTSEKCVPTTKSECQGDAYGVENPDGTLKVKVVGHDVVLHHEGVVLNCCFETSVCFTPKVDTIEVVEHISGGSPCFCECLFNIEATLPGIKSGSYNLTLFNEEHKKMLFKTTVVVP